MLLAVSCEHNWLGLTVAVNCHTCSKFTMLTASQQALKHGLSLEVDRLGELIDKLENKV